MPKPETSRRAVTWSLTRRMAFGLGSLLIVVGIVLALAALAYGRAAARDAFDRLLVGAANDIAASISVTDTGPVVDLPVSAFELLALAPDDRIAYQVRGPDGQVLTGYEDLPEQPRQGRVTEVQFYDATFGGEPARFIRVTRRFAERSLTGNVEVLVGQTVRARNELAFGITRNALIGLALGGFAMLALALLVVRSALRPLETLAATLAARDPQDLTPIDTHVPRELSPTVQAMNGFMQRLDRQFEAMRGLISDTAHQLRTPVAALRAQSDLAERELNPERRERLVARIHRRSVSLGRLLDQMLSRALVVHRIDSAKREAVDLREIALDIVEAGDHQAVSPETEVRLSVGDAPVVVMADSLSLGEAAKNLLGNALTHGEGPVTIGASVSDGEAQLWVRDQGEGPTQEVREQLGKRFVRSAASEGGNSGLGLSIASSVAEAFGGHMKLEDTPEGFRVVLSFRKETAS